MFSQEQRPAEELLQLDNLPAYRARGDTELGCRTRNAAMSRNRFKGDKTLQRWKVGDAQMYMPLAASPEIRFTRIKLTFWPAVECA
jgi:hypothetical protein